MILDRTDSRVTRPFSRSLSFLPDLLPRRAVSIDGTSSARYSWPLENLEDRLTVLAFELAAQRCALPLADVTEVQRAVAITRLPNAPAGVEGVFDLRGSLVPVMDLRARLGLPPKALEPGDRLVVATMRGLPVALRVDRTEWMLEVDQRAVESTTELAPDADLLAGVAKLPDGLLLICDLHRFLSRTEETALRGALRDVERTAQ